MKKKVLIIEDEKAYLETLQIFLRDEFKLFSASSLQEGLELLKKEKLDVIILDLSLPDIKDEQEVLEALQKIKSFKNKRIIILTGKPLFLNEDDAEKYVFYYLEKNDTLPHTALKFAIKHAFNDIDHKELISLNDAQLSVQERINLKKIDLPDTLKFICQKIQELTDCYTCHIRLFDQRTGDYKKECFVGPDNIEIIFDLPSKPEELYSGLAIAKREFVHKDSLQSDPIFLEWKSKKISEFSIKQVKEYFETIKSAYIVPLSTGLFINEIDAVLNISGNSESFFNSKRISIIEAFIKQIKIAIAKDWLDKKRWEVHADYKQSSSILEKISQKLKHNYNLNEVYKIAIQGISKIIGPEMISIFLFNEQTGFLENVAEFVGNRWHNSDEKHLPGKDITGKVFKQGKPKRLPNEIEKGSPLDHKWYDKSSLEQDLYLIPSQKVEHYLCVPMIVGEDKLGVIRLINKKSDYYKNLKKEKKLKDDPYCLLIRGFSSDCETVLGIIASHVAIAIQNASLLKRLNQRIDQQETIAKITRKIGSYYDGRKDELLKEIVKQTTEVTNAKVCLLFLKEFDGSTKLDLVETYGIDYFEASYDLNDNYITSKVARLGEPFLKGIPNKEEINTQNNPGRIDDQILELLNSSSEPIQTIDTFMLAPIFIDSKIIKNGKEVLGVLKVINKQNEEKFFNDEDLRMFEGFASQIGLAITVTERNESFSDLIGGVEHEIGNSIGVIQPNVERLLETLPELSQKDKETLQRISKVSASINEFNNDLVGFQEYSFRKNVNITKLIDECLASFEGTLKVINYSKVKIEKHYPKFDVICNVYETPFIHIINNILINAYHAMEIYDNDEKGVLTIKLEIEKGSNISRVKIDISDNGEGIDKNNLKKIFKARFTTKNNPKGNGLGLWLVKAAVKRIDGLIKVNSTKNLNKNWEKPVTTFTIYLPYTETGPGEIYP